MIDIIGQLLYHCQISSLLVTKVRIIGEIAISLIKKYTFFNNNHTTFVNSTSPASADHIQEKQGLRENDSTFARDRD